jgi:transforming growth factor-beta-induced protein
MRSLSRRVLALAAAGLLVLAACSDDDGDTAETTTTTAPAGMNGDDGMENGEAAGTIVDVAIAAGDFTTLVAAVQAADLADTLSGPGPFTVFAPTDAAFAALPEGALDDLLADPDALADVLTYHVVAGEFLAADVVGLTEVETVQGGTLPVEVDGDTVRIGGATVVATDVQASNGVIHVIDTVLLP